MNNQHFKEIQHNPIQPVKVERDGSDTLIIEGVKYAGDMFRMFALPDDEILYAIRRDGDMVWLTQVHNLDEAKKFFEEIGDPLPNLPQMGEEHPNFGEEEFQGDEDGI